MKAQALLARMRANPLDWQISDIERVCRGYGLLCYPPKGGGSHYKVSHPRSAAIVTVPARRPIKPVYIGMLIALIDSLALDRP